MEKLNAGYEHFKGAYQSAQALPSSGQCAKDIGALNISEEISQELWMNFYATEKP